MHEANYYDKFGKMDTSLIRIAVKPVTDPLDLHTLAEREHVSRDRLLRLTTYSDGDATFAIENDDGDPVLHQMCLTTDLAGLRRIRQMVDGALHDLESL